MGTFSPVSLTHNLGVALRFVDMFSRRVVEVPLKVTVDALRWQAFRSESDGTYRFVATNRPVPAGNFVVTVTDSSGIYSSREQLQVTLPVVIGHPPPLVRADYLVDVPLWPTPGFRSAQGETVVRGRVVSAGANVASALRVFLFPPPGPRPAQPYAWPDENGDFLFRIPGLRGSMSGNVPVTTATLDAEVLDAANNPVVPVNPANLVVRLGQTEYFVFNAP